MGGILDDKASRNQAFKELVDELHGGATVEDVKQRFANLIEGVSPAEISQMEQALISEGLPVEEVQRMCDVHAAVFRDALDAKDAEPDLEEAMATPGHPANTFAQENRALEDLLTQMEKTLGAADFPHDEFMAQANLLMDIDKHYSRKENLLFPYLEKHGIEGPVKVMWGVDDEIRDAVKAVRRMVAGEVSPDDLKREFDAVAGRIRDMIFKEENILFPMAMENLSLEEWFAVASESDAVGYCIVVPEAVWAPEGLASEQEAFADGMIHFETGIVSAKQFELILNHLPIDMTFVDADGIVRYFSNSPERIFVRTKAIIGRHVSNCHPPQSVHVVEKLLEDFATGAKDSESFWLQMGEKFIHISYYAVRDEQGTYLGTVEVSQDIAPLRALEGQKVLMG